MREVIENELGGEIALPKAAVVASHQALATAIRRRLGECAGLRQRTTVSLGIDFAARLARTSYRRKGKVAERMRAATGKMRAWRGLPARPATAAPVRSSPRG